MRLVTIAMLGLLTAFSIVGCVQAPSDNNTTQLSVVEPGTCEATPETVTVPMDLFLPGSVQHFTPGSDKVELTPLPGGPTTQVNCSSVDRKKDCFCGDKGCWRTQTDCGCCK